jgi:hypothetical protein
MGFFQKCLDGLEGFFFTCQDKVYDVFGVAPEYAYAVLDCRYYKINIGEMFLELEDAREHAEYSEKLTGQPFRVIKVRIEPVNYSCEN